MANKARNGSGIHIKKSHRGEFTDYCGGTVTDKCIQMGKRSTDPKIRKQAIFAQNARKFKHQYGGSIYQQQPMYNYGQTSPYSQAQPYQATLTQPQQNTVYGPSQIHYDANFTSEDPRQIQQNKLDIYKKQALLQEEEKAKRQEQVQKANAFGSIAGDLAGEGISFLFNKIKSARAKNEAGMEGDSDAELSDVDLQQTDGNKFFQMEPLQLPMQYYPTQSQYTRLYQYGGDLVKMNKYNPFVSDPFDTAKDYYVSYKSVEDTETEPLIKPSKTTDKLDDKSFDYGLYIPQSAPETKQENNKISQDNEEWFSHDDNESNTVINQKRNSYKETTIGQFDSDFNMYGKDSIFTQHKAFWKNLAKAESGFRPYVRNKEGAYGYFQIMPSSRTGESIKTQFEDAARLMKQHMSMITSDDRKIARQKGITEEGLMAGVWLGGPLGVKRALRGKGNAKDSNGTSVMGYMLKFSK